MTYLPVNDRVTEHFSFTKFPMMLYKLSLYILKTARYCGDIYYRFPTLRYQNFQRH